MSYRDWERGETSPRKRPPTSPWDGSGDRPVEPYSRSAEGYRTRSRRRAAERGQQEPPADDYLPWWALESGAPDPDGEGRHRHGIRPDDDVPSRADLGWRTTETTRTWSRVTGTTRWHEAPGSGAGRSEHTGEWRVADPTAEGGGYVGSRRAGEDPDPTRTGTAHPGGPPPRSPVVWFGEQGYARSDDLPEAGGTPRRGWPAAEESWPRVTGGQPPPWEPSSRGAQWPADPAVPPPAAVDPWDASGLHAWERPQVSGPEGTGQWDRSTDTGQWNRPTDTGQWERPTRVGQWGGGTDTGQWDRASGTGRWGDTGARRSAGGPDDSGGRPWPEHDERFWSGTRLSGDDPRWMETPASAPRSPTVPGWSEPRPHAGRPATSPAADRPGGGPTGRVAGRPDGTSAAGARRRPAPVAPTSSGERARRIEEDLLDPDPGGAVRPLVYTVVCYLLPAVALFVWLLTLSGQAPAGCVTDLAGGGCDSPRAHAIDSFVAGGPRFGLALATSLVVALLLRRIGTWRAASTALASAVVGGGLSTVLISVLTGEPIG